MRALSKDLVPGRFSGGGLAGDVDASDPWQAEWEQRRAGSDPAAVVRLEVLS